MYLQKWLFQIRWIMPIGYSLHLDRNTEPRCNDESGDISSVLWDVCGS